jgi:hypothetical protein
VLVVNNGGTSSAQGYVFQFNGDTGTNYSFNTFWSPSSGSTVGTFGPSNTTGIYQFSGLAGSTTTIVLAGTINIMNYSNTNTYKTILQRSQSEQTTQALVGLWRNTSAITSINLFMGSGNIQSGSTFSLYGIKAADITSIIPTKAFGGDAIVTDGTYTYHAFKSSGVFSPVVALTADVLVIAGGGGTGANNVAPGGGGAGGLVWHSGRSISASTPITVTVGGGGTSNTSALTSVNSLNGSNSVFDTITANGGGGSYGYQTPTYYNGASGGSGGGGAGGNNSSPYQNGTGGSATQTNSGGGTGYGNSGGNGAVYTFYQGVGGGGGGAGAAGTNAAAYSSRSSAAGNGGDGLSGTTIAALDAIGAATNTGEFSGGHYYYAGGAGGGAGGPGSVLGGRGLGGSGAVGNGPGIPFTGGGGGNGASTGGSGLVVVRYLS